MKIIAPLAAAALMLGSAVAIAQTTPDGATANEKPGQGTNTGSMKKDGTMMKDGKMMPPANDAGTSGTSAGTGEAASPAQPSMAPQTPNSGKGVPDTK